MSTPSSITTPSALGRQPTLPGSDTDDCALDSRDAAQSSALPQTQLQNNRDPLTTEKTLTEPELAPNDDQSVGKAPARVEDDTPSTPYVIVQKAQAREKETMEGAQPTVAHTFSSADEEDERPGVLYIRWSDKAGRRHVKEVESHEDTSEGIAFDEDTSEGIADEDISEEEYDSKPKLKRMTSFSVSIAC